MPENEKEPAKLKEEEDAVWGEYLDYLQEHDLDQLEEIEFGEGFDVFASYQKALDDDRILRAELEDEILEQDSKTSPDE